MGGVAQFLRTTCLAGKVKLDGLDADICRASGHGWVQFWGVDGGGKGGGDGGGKVRGLSAGGAYTAG